MSGLPSHPAQLPSVPTPELALRSKSQPLLDGGREKNTTSPSNGSVLLPIHHGDGANGEVMPPADSSPDAGRDGSEGGTAELVRLYGRSAGK